MQTQDVVRRTVGDTATIVHRVAIPRDGMVEARVPTDSSLVTMVGSPMVTREGDSVRIAYTVTYWATGQHQLVFPGPIVARPGVRPDTLADLHVALDVSSVLPARNLDSLPVKGPRTWLPSAEPSTLPLVLLLPSLLLMLGALHWWWRRRGPRPATVPVPPAPVLTEARIAEWLAAGEGRMVLRHLEAKMNSETRFDGWRARVAAVRYAPVSAPVIDALVKEGWALLQVSAGQ